MKKKLMFITPHLSTGGLPQYLLKKIETFNEQYEIYCIEWDDITGGRFVVQRNKIKEILKHNFLTLNQNKNQVLKNIQNISPDIIHFEEIPETFISDDILLKIYDKNRKHLIFVTTHSSYTKPEELVFLADKFILVSEWSKNTFDKKLPQIPTGIWEYPVEIKTFNKELAKQTLKFDENYFHILNVGLFTPGKNQKELIEIAKSLLDYPIKFHFVGNQADNFKDYWQPLMNEFPSNCIWWDERSDVDLFYQAADLFYFSSLFELNPLVLKEALSYQLPIFCKKLETYENTYDGLVTYITNDLEKNKDKILDFLMFNKLDNSISDEIDKEKISNVNLYHILTDIDSDREIESMNSLTKLEDYNINYNHIISKKYTLLPPKENCKHPDKISFEPGNSLTPGHYGCYLGHKKAFYQGLKDDKDFMIICECDCALNVSYKNFVDCLNLAKIKIDEDDLLMFSFGFHNNTNIIEDKEDYYIVNAFYGAHCYLIPKKSYKIIDEMYQNSLWDVTDLLFAENLNKYKIGIFKEPITKQVQGFSILDKKYNEERF